MRVVVFYNKLILFLVAVGNEAKFDNFLEKRESVMANKSGKNVVVRIVLVVVFFILNELWEMFYPIGLMTMLNIKKVHPSAREAGCFSNQRVILGALEMYNMDNEPGFVPGSAAIPAADMLKILKDGKYLKSIPECGNRGKYEFYVDKNGGYSPYCTYHGSINRETDMTAPGISQECKDNLAAQKQEKLMKKLMPILIYGGLIALAIFI